MSKSLESRRDFTVTEPNGCFSNTLTCDACHVRAVDGAVCLSMPGPVSLRWVRAILFVGVVDGFGQREVCRFVRHMGGYVHPVASSKRNVSLLGSSFPTAGIRAVLH